MYWELMEALAAVIEGYDIAISSHPAEFVSLAHAKAFAAVIERAREAIRKFGGSK